MLAKLTSKNQLTLPKSAVQSVGQADAVRAKLEALGIDEQDVNDAIAWARRE